VPLSEKSQGVLDVVEIIIFVVIIIIAIEEVVASFLLFRILLRPPLVDSAQQARKELAQTPSTAKCKMQTIWLVGN